MYYLLGYSVHHINGFIINQGLKVIARINSYCLRQSQTTTPDQLLQMTIILDFQNLMILCTSVCTVLHSFFLLGNQIWFLQVVKIVKVLAI